MGAPAGPPEGQGTEVINGRQTPALPRRMGAGLLSTERTGRRNKLMFSIMEGLWERRWLSTGLPPDGDGDGAGHSAVAPQGRPAWRQGDGWGSLGKGLGGSSLTPEGLRGPEAWRGSHGAWGWGHGGHAVAGPVAQTGGDRGQGRWADPAASGCAAFTSPTAHSISPSPRPTGLGTAIGTMISSQLGPARRLPTPSRPLARARALNDRRIK